jgi:glycosyltransferase involved in cell wall biosynthesis
MRLLVITAWPLDTPGGIQTLVRNLAATLARMKGLELEVVTGAMPGAATLALATPAHPSRRLPLRPGPRPAWMPPDRELVGPGWLHGLEEVARAFQPDVLLCVSHHSAETHQAATVARILGVPLALWPLIHADDPRHVNATAAGLYRTADLVIASSVGERGWLTEQAGVAPASTMLLDCGSWAAESPPSDPRPPLAGARAELLSVGGFAPHKRFEDQIEAIARLRTGGVPARLTLAGAVQGRRAVDRLVELVRRRGLDGEVALLTDVDERALPTLYASANYFLFTSASESFGLAVLDAICAGVYPVVYPHPTYAGLVEASNFGRLATRSTPDALAAAVVRAIAEGEPRRGPAPDWRAAHAWPRVAGSLLARLRGLRR